jgi:hypothetical protein
MLRHTFASLFRDVLEKPPRLGTRDDSDKTHEDKNDSSYETHISTSTRIQGTTTPKTVVFTEIGVKTSDIVERDSTLLCGRAWSSSPLDGTGPQIHCCVPDSPILPSLGSAGNTNGPPLTATPDEHAKQTAWFCSRNLRPRLI